MKTEDGLKKASRLLLEQYWIVREEQQEEFDLVKKFEPQLKIWFREKLGFELVVHRKMFARLEKIPAVASEHMVLEPDVFKSSMDYTILFSLFAFFEGRYDETFLISDFCEELRANLGEQDEKFLEKHRNRLSLIRVFKYTMRMGILIHRDGDIDAFEKEVLFKIPPIARFFIRQFPCAVRDGLQNPDLFTGLPPKERRQRIYRTLLLEPALLFSRQEPEDVQYIKKQFPVLKKDLFIHTHFQAEFYTEGVICVRRDPEGSTMRDFPADSSISDLALQLAECLKLKYLNSDIMPDDAGSITMNRFDWEEMLLQLKNENSSYWKTDYADLKLESLDKEITRYLMSWGMIERPDAHTVIIAPHVVRVTGKIYLKGEQVNEVETE
ncbi:TIGR02678 family protein [Paenibacillus sp. yr247]|uniref:TIGR02678 family protein n=1 Tax=Paenibacillus sp. yr247 TaxID=1761880 RepID=UPI00088F5804|nr:TIGR02678 family protein [Paenibacillus sp. yr247]SDN61601.1 TIGR02678 family protein [Paenibacillus sp. yr247]